MSEGFNPELFDLPVLDCLKSRTLRRIFGEFDRILTNNIDLIDHLLVHLGYQDRPNNLGPHLVHYENLAREGRMFFNELIAELINNGHVNDLINLRVLYARLGNEIRFASVRDMILAHQDAILEELRLINEPPLVVEPQPNVRTTPVYVVYHPEQTKTFPNAFAYFLDRIRDNPNLQLTEINLSVAEAVVNNFIDLIMPRRDGIIIFLYDNFINRILLNNVAGYDTIRRLYYQAYNEYLDSFENRRFVAVIAGQFNETRFPYQWLLMANIPPIRLFQGDSPNQHHEELLNRQTQSLLHLIFNSPLLHQAN